MFALCVLQLLIATLCGPGFQEPAPDKVSLHALVDRLYAAYAEEKLEEFFSQWSLKSSDLTSRRQQLQKLFADNERIEVRSVTLLKMKVDGERASLRVVVEMGTTQGKTGEVAAGFGRMIRALKCIKEDGQWKVMREVEAEEELAEAIIAARTGQERAALLAEEKELVTVKLRQELIKRGDRLRRQGDYSHALAIHHLAHGVAEAIGDESTALLAVFDQDTGEGDDNSDSAALHAVRVGPVIEVVWTARSGETHDENPVAQATDGIDDTVAAAVARVSEALEG